jgi:uncharacterized protein
MSKKLEVIDSSNPDEVFINGVDLSKVRGGKGMKRMNRKEYLKEMQEKNLVVSGSGKNKIYLHDVIMSRIAKREIVSFDKKATHGVWFKDGNCLDCRSANLKLVKLYD